MTSLFRADDNGLRAVRLSDVIAEGAAGTIHRVIGEPGLVAKLYKERKDLPVYQEKIAAMLASPPNLLPSSYSGRIFVQIAWPIASIVESNGQFRGFVMPEVDFQASTELGNILQKSTRQHKRLPEFYGGRVLLAANLAALMVELHAQGHYMVDMKPTNMRFYPTAWQMAILDTDGFSINGGRRFPSLQFSDEYISPEAHKQKPEQLGLEQDLFALAVIIFRLLNNGIHPFQGVDYGNGPTTLQERIFGGLYPYGLSSHSKVKPVPSSMHEFLEDQTRVLFDRAFAKTYRPTAIEWRDHLNGLINGRVLVRCIANHAEHAHFSKGCGLCAQQRRASKAVQSSSVVLTNLPKAKQASPQPPLIATGRVVVATKAKELRRSKIVIFSTVAIIGFCIFALRELSPTAPQTAPNATVERQSSASPLSPVTQLPFTPPKAFVSPPTDVKISIGRALKDGALRNVISDATQGPKAHIAARVAYQGQDSGLGQIVMKSPDRDWPCLDERPINKGKSELACEWPESVDVGSYRVVFLFNGSIVDEKAFRVINPPQGSGCKSSLYTAINDGLVWGKSCSIGNERWRYWCTNGTVFDYSEGQAFPSEGLQTNCADVTKVNASNAPEVP